MLCISFTVMLNVRAYFRKWNNGNNSEQCCSFVSESHTASHEYSGKQIPGDTPTVGDDFKTKFRMVLSLETSLANQLDIFCQIILIHIPSLMRLFYLCMLLFSLIALL